MAVEVGKVYRKGVDRKGVGDRIGKVRGSGTWVSFVAKEDW